MSKENNISKPFRTIKPLLPTTPSEGGNAGQIPVTQNPPPPKK